MLIQISSTVTQVLTPDEAAGVVVGVLTFNIKSPEVIALGFKNVILEVSKAGIITRATMISMLAGAKQAGDLELEIYKNGAKISAGEPLELNSASEVNNTTLTGWTKDFVANDEFTIKVIGTPATVQNVDIYLRYDITGA